MTVHVRIVPSTHKDISLCVCVRTGVGADSCPTGTKTLLKKKKKRGMNILLMSSVFQLRGKEEILTRGVCFRVSSSKLHTQKCSTFILKVLEVSNHTERYRFIYFHF